MKVCWVVLAAAGTITTVGCGEAPCEAGETRCEGEMRLSCVQNGEDRSWEASPCPESSTCLEGQCARTPLQPCDAAKVGTGRCDPSNRFPGVCTASGYWFHDAEKPCREGLERCQTALEQSGGTPLPIALCVMDPPSICTPGSPGGFCHNDLAATCASVGFLVLVEDCRERGMVCRQGACVP